MTTPATTTHRAASTERAIALATTVTPIATGVIAPLLDGGAAFTATLAYAGTAGFLAANYMNRLPPGLAYHLPAADIVHAHRSPLFISTLTTGTALALGTLMGSEGADALMAGVLTLPSIPGIVSLGWWAAVALVPLKLRNVLRRPRPTTTAPTALAGMPIPAGSPADLIARRWAQHISHPKNGTHRGQELTVTTLTPTRWAGIITAPTGATVTVTPDAISSVYQIPATWITMQTGTHAGERLITVNLTAPADLDPSTLSGAWKKWVAKTNGLMAGTHLEDVQDDPNTGGQVAYVVAGENLDRLPTPDRASLAGALRTNTLLCSYNPTPGNPRRGEIRLMKENPLQNGVPFPGRSVLEISDGGYVQIGRHVSGFPARIQFTDPKLGARHVFIAGVTGSGKGGLVQIVALADHVNGHAIIYIDPKGSSNPDVETMAAYSGLGEEGSIQGLRVAYALMQWRIAESARLKMKNFVATPERPWVRVILDEAHVPLSELEEHKKEAQTILEALAAKARSLGIILCIVNQAMNADKLGGSTALRTNVIQGGSLVMLRTDSGQQHLATTGFEGVDPGEIPAAWDVDRPLVYDDTVALEDPRTTFGLGYTLGPGGAAEMMRTFMLESAAEHIDGSAIAYPADWPDWGNRHEIANTPILGDDQAGGGEYDGFSTALFGGPAPTKKPASTKEKILQALEEAADPLGLETLYMDKEQLSTVTGATGPTLNNALTDLAKAGKIHRQMKDGKEVRGMYGLGIGPIDAA
ncbi:type IV secretory system conjugative DNA transfer family protein [Streptomyces sp. BE133]|uniref:type IV secretory system conjugative DNA transfer family protein n=1 Tax=Streptomyces sp. BE133 TaxID=3002523 RepID=UPI002E792A15|nr:type IV secretory system conjugative DNA transfer family protein [Streptomyces sp. BE133]MEE1812727.1 type IV secretory system conjugative DNA transfer family protein [Streptomyces sp. BE133]